MKKRCLSIALAMSMVLSMIPAVGAAELTVPEGGFLLPVAVELPEKQSSGLMMNADEIELPDVTGTGFISELSAAMPTIREDGFLTEPTTTLKTFPEAGKLLAEVGDPDETATPVSTAAELAAMTSDGNYVLTADIDLSEANWVPIDSVSNITLDGQGHVISGMTLDGAHWAGGLFGQAETMTIRNLVVSAPTFTNSRQKVGTLIGYAYGNVTIENCSVENITTAVGSSFGGLIGEFYDKESGLTITDCAVVISLTQARTSTTGGLVGSVEALNAEFTDCLVNSSFSGVGSGLSSRVSCAENFSMLRCAVTGELTGCQLNYAAGMINSVNSAACYVTDCVFDGNIDYSTEVTNYNSCPGGGFFGKAYSSTTVFTNCRASGAIQNVAANAFGGVGSFAGTAYSKGSITFDHCLADMDINVTFSDYTESYVGGLMGESPQSFYAVDCLNTGDLSIGETEDDTVYMGGLLGYATSPSTTQFLRCENRGNITAETDAGGMVATGESASASFSFTDCKNSGDISCPTTYSSVGGMLGYGTATVRNCVNTGDLSSYYVGGMVGRSGDGSVFYDCRANFTTSVFNTTSSVSYGGGLVGYEGKNAYENCAVDVTFAIPPSVRAIVGGLTSTGSGTVERCAVKTRFTGESLNSPTLGGMFAWANGPVTITDSTSDFAVTDVTFASLGYTGGLVGTMHTSLLTVDNCAVKCEVDAPTTTSAGYAGGMLGYTFDSAVISNSYVTGSIDMRPDVVGGAQGYAAGLVAYMASGSDLLTIDRCWTDVDISGADAMGGLVGSSYNTTAIISSSWADGTLSLKDVIPLLTEEATVASSYLGGLVGYNNSVYQTGASSNMVIQDCYFDGQIECADAQYTGGIIGNGGRLIYNCYSTEDLTVTVNPGNLDRTRSIGGLAGGTGTISYCRYDGSVTVPCEQEALNVHDFAGGIAGYGTAQNCQSTASVRGYNAGGIVGSGDAFDCSFEGSVIGLETVGGILAQGGAENCTSSGYVQGCTVGGIAGFASGDIIGCTSDCALYLHSECTDTAHSIGGIAGRTTSYDIYDSHYLRHLQVTFTDSSGYDSTYLFVGGITGDAGKVISGCTSKGVTVYSHGIRELAIGGIAGEISPGTIDNCRVDGNVYVRGWGNGTSSSRLYESLYAGGLFGYGGNVSIANCIVNADISTDFIPSDQYKKYAVIQDGRFGGCASDLTVENCQFNGLFTPGPKLPSDDYSSTGTSIVGRCSFVKYADVPDVNSPEKPVEGYQVTVLSHNVDGSLLPMEGITVYANNTSVGTTDANGQVTFDSNKFSSYAVIWLSASADGYFESRHCTFLADGGSYTLVLKEKQPGVIYFKSAVMVGEETGTSDLLSNLTDLQINILDTEHYPLTVEIDWNDLDEENRSAMLVNEDRTHMIHIPDGSETVNVNLPGTFEAGEDIYLRATGTKDGETITKEELLSVKVVATSVNFDTEKGEMDVGGAGDKDDDKHLYFLRGLQLGVNFDDLADYASAITYKNGTLTVKYDMKEQHNSSASIWDGYSEKVTVGGEVKIPISNLNEGEWSGKVTVSVGNKTENNVSNKAVREENEKHLKKDEFDKATLTYDFVIGGVPCFLETGLEVGGSASFGIHGPLGETYVDGDVTVSGGGSIFAGLGGEVTREIEFKVGGEGKLDATIPFKFDTLNPDFFDLDPKLEGNVNAKISAKAYFLELQAALRLGGFLWNKNGAEWTWLDEEPNPGEDDTIGDGGTAGGRSAYSLRRSAPSYAWVAMNRDYLAEGGGFLTHDVSSFAFNTSSNQNLRYENIGDLTETAMTTENGQTVLYFTADDGSAAGGDVTTHTVLYRTVQQTDGNWSEPAAVSSTTDGYPASPYADGSFVVWTESSEVDTLDNMLQSTRIRVAQNGQIVHTIETEGYVYAPKVSAGADGTSAVVSWLSDPEVSSENLLGGNPKLYYASCFSGTWSNAKEMTTTGVPLSAAPLCGTGNSSSYLYYVNDTGSYLYQTLSNSSSTLASVPAGRTVLFGNLAACFAEDGTLIIYRGSSATTKTVRYNGTAAPAFAYDGTTYGLFWPEDDGIRFMTSTDGYAWSDPVLLTGMDSGTTELCTAMTGGDPIAAYTQSADGLTHLYTASMAADGVDLVLTELEYDPRDMMERDYIIFNGQLHNNGMTKADGFTVTVTDETGTQIFTRTYTKAVATGGTADFSAAFAPDGQSEHTFTFAVTPVVAEAAVADADVSDNALDITVGQPSAQIVDANFQQAPDGTVQLCAMVRNTGAALLNGATVQMATVSGDTVLSQIYRGDEAIPYGSIRQLLVENAQPNTYYEVSVLYADEVLDSTMLMYEDPNAQLLTASGVSIDGDTAQVSLFGQNQTLSSGKVILALYDGVKMAAVGTQTLSALNGSQNLDISLSDAPNGGSYDYKVFFLSDGESYAPIAPCVSGSVSVK